MPLGLKPSVCVDAVFEGMPTHETLEHVKQAGIGAFEFWGWWDKDLKAIQEAQSQLGLDIAACCTHFVSLVDPARRAEYLDGLQRSVETAKTLKCPTLISQVGDFLSGVDRDQQRQSLIDGLVAAAPLLETAQVTLVIEPLNEQVDHPGYYLIRSDEAFDIVKQVNSPRVKVVFDIYHQQISEGHLIHNITQNIDWIGHFHAAGNPGRHELTVGEINYPAVFDAIKATSYNGYVGLEYWPTLTPSVGLKEVSGWFDSAG